MPFPLLMRRRAGFTLVEIAVTLGLLVVILACVFPIVFHKTGAGGAAKVQTDLQTVQTALESFAADSKAGFPDLISTLTTQPSAATTRLIDSTAMTANQVISWHGPYLGVKIGAAPGDSFATGYSASIMNFVDRYDAVTNAPEHNASGTANPSFSTTSTLFAALQIRGLTPEQAASLNTLIDGAADSIVGGASTTGRFRFTAPAGGVVAAYYLAVPITT